MSPKVFMEIKFYITVNMAIDTIKKQDNFIALQDA